MTLPKKASRAIDVDGRLYRWMVRRRGGHIRLTIEDSETKDIFQRDYHAIGGDDDGDGATTVVSSAKVRKFIKELKNPIL